MGHITKSKLIFVACCLVLTNLLIYSQTSSPVLTKQRSLNEVLKRIDGWQTRGRVDLDGKIVKALDLDDYANHYFTDGSTGLFLYIGYYLEGGKVGAAHDPLVCFPGQGWAMSNQSRDEIVLNPGLGQKISFSSMIVNRGKSRQLLIYWFQAYDRTGADTFSQKVSNLWNKVIGKRQDNAFVRISSDLNGTSIDKARDNIFRFIRSFYPVFQQYIKDGQ